MSEEVVRRHRLEMLVAVGVIGVVIALVALAGFPFSSDTGTGSGSSGGLFGGLAGATVVPSDEDGGVVHGDGFTVTTIDDGYQDYRADLKDFKITRISILPGTSEKPVSGVRFRITYWSDEKLLDGILFMAPSIENLKENRNKWPTAKLGISEEKVWDKKTGEKLYYKYHATFTVGKDVPAYIWIIHKGSGDRSAEWEASYIYRIDI